MKMYKVITEDNETRMFDSVDDVFVYIEKKINDSGKKVIAPVIEIIETGYERIKTFEDACYFLGLSQIEARTACCKGAAGAREEARRKLEIITKAINEGWEPDILDFSQNKWYPWLKVVKKNKPSPNLPETPYAGLVFVNAHYAPSITSAKLGSRLCFKDEKRAIHAAQHFMDLYEIMLLG